MEFFIMDCHGNLDLNHNKVLAPAIGQEIDKPTTGVPVGRLCYSAADNKIYICVSIISVPIWVPLNNGAEDYVHEQETPSTVWTINHNLGMDTAFVVPYDEDKKQIIPDSIRFDNANTVTITFAGAVSGKAVIVAKSAVGSGFTAPPDFEHEQTTPSQLWTVEHNLGFKPLVNIVLEDGNQMYPAFVRHVDMSTMEIGFTSLTSGTARCL